MMVIRAFGEKTKGNKIRPGMAIVFNDLPHKVTKMTQGKKGKGGGFCKTTLKNMVTGQTYEKTFTADVVVDMADLERETFQYSWSDGDNFSFLSAVTFEETRVPWADVEDRDYLVEGREVTLLKFNGNVIGCELPTTADYDVVRVDLNNKSASNYHTVILESGAEVSVPDFIGVGTRIKVNIPERAYIERVTT